MRAVDDVVGVVDFDDDVTRHRRARSSISPAPLTIQQGEAFFEIQRGVHVVERQAQLHHRKGDLWLQAHDHGVRAAQPGHVGDGAQRPGGERVHHVDGGDVDDDALRAEPADPFHEVVPQPFGVGVGQRGLHRGDQDRALFQDGNWHGVLVLIVFTRCCSPVRVTS